ncbi:MAG: glycoside hydrolase family 27 protein [Candidatus Ornithomonoglobus sp.]
MMSYKPPMGWNSWNTFAQNINEKLIMEIADVMVSDGYKDAGYEYVIIDDCWSLKERVDGRLVPDPELFPNGMKYLADYIHSKGLKFGMYSCAGFKTCAGYPSSYGHEFEDAKQFAEWGVDYLKYDFCNFPQSADTKNAYLTMAMALRCSGRDILFAACNWGVENPSQWMRSRGAHTYRSTGDIFDTPKSYIDIFKSQVANIENNAPGCYNDMDMLITGMRGKGNVGLQGCSDTQYLQHFAMWAFMGSPLIIGADIRNIDKENRAVLLNKGLIAINQDEECRPAFCVSDNGRSYVLARFLSKGRFALGLFNTTDDDESWEASRLDVSFDDLGIHSCSGKAVRFKDAVTGEDAGVYKDGCIFHVEPYSCKIVIGEIING